MERQKQAMELRKQGLSQVQIAERLGVNQSTISNDLKVAFEAYAKECDEERVHWARLDLLRVEAMLFALWPKVEQGDSQATTVALRALERRAKLLGLDAQVATGPEMTAEQIRDILKQRGVIVE